MYRLAIFDLDGTLLDTSADLTDAVNHALAALSIPRRLPAEVVRLCFGGGITDDMRKVLAAAGGCPAADIPEVGVRVPLSAYGVTPEKVEALRGVFSPWYAAHREERTAPYPGILTLLETLRARGVKTAVASNKDDSDVQALITRYFPGLFDVVMGSSPWIRRKPAPDMVDAIRAALGASREDTVYIGDTEFDLATAENAGVVSFAVTWGFRPAGFLTASGAQRRVSSAKELARAILG